MAEPLLQVRISLNLANRFSHRIFSKLWRLSRACPSPLLPPFTAPPWAADSKPRCAATIVSQSPPPELGCPKSLSDSYPGGGGTQRLPRLIGPEAALEAITSGTPMKASQAHAVGVIDEIIDEGNLLEGAKAFARELVAEGAKLQ